MHHLTAELARDGPLSAKACFAPSIWMPKAASPSAFHSTTASSLRGAVMRAMRFDSTATTPSRQHPRARRPWEALSKCASNSASHLRDSQLLR